MKSEKYIHPSGYRGIDESFAEDIKTSVLYQLWKDHQDELMFGIRDGYVNIYHLCNSIAKIERFARKTPVQGQEPVVSTISPYYLHGIKKNKRDNKMICEKYEQITDQSHTRQKIEKQCQQKLALLNNQNPDSNWYCIDVEYMKPKMAGRFDIIAVSKSVPHRVALIELKYGSGAYGGDSGLLTHVKDFKAFKENGNYANLKKDIVGIVRGLQMLEVPLPNSLIDLKEEELFEEPEFFFITVDNNPKSVREVTPLQSMAGYLFKESNAKYRDWKCRKHSQKAVEDTLGIDITKKDSVFNATILFTSQTNETLSISDIIDGEYDVRIIPD